MNDGGPGDARPAQTNSSRVRPANAGKGRVREKELLRAAGAEVGELGTRMLAKRLVQSLASKAQAVDASEFMTVLAIRIAKSPRELGAVRLAAIKYIHEIAGILDPDLRASKPVNEMTPGELDALIGSMRAELEHRAAGVVKLPGDAVANPAPAGPGSSDSQSDPGAAAAAPRWRPAAVAATTARDAATLDPPPTPTRDDARKISGDTLRKIPPIE